MKIVDITGQRFGKILVLRQLEERSIDKNTGKKRIQYECKCDCGKIYITRGENIRNGHSTSCGCSHKIREPIDLIGKTYKTWEVIKLSNKKKKESKNKNEEQYSYYWECKCNCGCGEVKIFKGYTLKKHKVSLCKEQRKKLKNYVCENKKINNFTIIKCVQILPNYIYECICDCGSIHYLSEDFLIKNKEKKCNFCNSEIELSVNRDDFINKKFERLSVINFSHFDYTGHIVWNCKCDCGNFKKVREDSLKNGMIKSCGCLHKEVVKETSPLNIVGEKYGYLTVIERVENNKHKQTKWLCKCDCGNIITVIGARLISGHTLTCGCKNSKGEFLISQFLKEKNIQFSSQYIDKRCKYKSYLKFDFSLMIDNELILIEYDGAFHYFPISFKKEDIESANIRFKIQKQKDEIKNNFCKENGIKLIRIPYWDFKNINTILSKELNLE